MAAAAATAAAAALPILLGELLSERHSQPLWRADPIIVEDNPTAAAAAAAQDKKLKMTSSLTKILMTRTTPTPTTTPTRRMTLLLRVVDVIRAPLLFAEVTLLGHSSRSEEAAEAYLLMAEGFREDQSTPP